MELAAGGGGCAGAHRCRPNLSLPASVPSIWNLFSRSLNCGILGVARRRRCRGLAAAPRPAKLSAERRSFRTCACWHEKRNLSMQSSLKNSHIPLRVLGSHGPQETNFDSALVGKNKLLIDCGPDQECVVGGIVALGKFDALHIGHRELAIQASKAGVPFLLSFVGMAKVLGWEDRAPVVAKSDRKRVFSSWAPYCGNVIPQEYQVEFSSVRYLSPQQFVERLSKELGVTGVVAGENYRFGYKASGDASELVKLCEEYGLEAYIVGAVMDDAYRYQNGASSSSNKRENVSSTCVRHALAMGDMEYVEQVLGRKHRLVLAVNKECLLSGNKVSIPKSSMLNQPPMEGLYVKCSCLVDDKFICPCSVMHDSRHIHVEFDDDGNSLVRQLSEHQLISLEFGVLEHVIGR